MAALTRETYVKYSLEVNSAVTFFNLGTTGVLRWVILCRGELFCTFLKTTDILEEEEAELNEARRGNQGDSGCLVFLSKTM